MSGHCHAGNCDMCGRLMFCIPRETASGMYVHPGCYKPSELDDERDAKYRGEALAILATSRGNWRRNGR